MSDGEIEVLKRRVAELEEANVKLLNAIDLDDIGDLVGMVIWGMKRAEESLDNEEGCEGHDEPLIDRIWIASKRLGDGMDAAGNLVLRLKGHIPEHYLEGRKLRD
jgi:hypothetical protein